MEMCMVDANGRFIEILQDDRVPNEGEFKVPLSNYYDVLIDERREFAIWDFYGEKFVGAGEQRPEHPNEPTEIDILKQQLKEAREANKVAMKAMAELYEIVFSGPTA